MKIKRIEKYFIANWYEILFCAVVILGMILRSYNFYGRVDYGSDSARDVMIAREALTRSALPLFASFSSTGPYVFGPEYYWTNMVSYFIFPGDLAPFILLWASGIFAIGVMMHAARILAGKSLSIICGLFIAVSPQFIARSIFLSQHAYLGILSVVAFLFFALLLTKKRPIYSFLLGLTVGMATMFHYAGINLIFFLVVFPFISAVNLKHKLIHIFYFCTGFWIAWIPLLIWDMNQNFANLRNFLDFILIAQYRLYVPNSWKIFLVTFLPNYWSNVVGGYRTIAFMLIIGSGLTVTAAIMKGKITRNVLLTSIVFGTLLLVNRYYSGERFDGYVIFIAPFIFFFSAYFVQQILYASGKKNRLTTFVASVLIIIIVMGSLYNAKQFIFKDNQHTSQIYATALKLIKKYPDRKFVIYDYLWKSPDDSYTLALFLNQMERSAKNGMAIGVMSQAASMDTSVVIGDMWNNKLIDLSTKKILPLNGSWVRVNQSDVYDDLITRWTNKQKLTSSFNPKFYILERLHLR